MSIRFHLFTCVCSSCGAENEAEGTAPSAYEAMTNPIWPEPVRCPECGATHSVSYDADLVDGQYVPTIDVHPETD